MIVNVDELRRVKAYMDAINHEMLSDITWIENGLEVKIPDEQTTIKNFDFTGLNNTDFIFTDCYKDGYTDI